MTHPAPAPNSTSPARPFRVLGVQQIAVGAPSRAPLRRLWTDLLGLEAVGQFESETENVREDILQLGSGARAVELDLMEPYVPGARPRVDQPALNHLGLWVDDLAAAYTWLEARGMRFAAGGIRPGASGHRVCFIHPRGDALHPLCGEGVLIELVQAPPNVVEAYAVSSSDGLVPAVE